MYVCVWPISWVDTQDWKHRFHVPGIMLPDFATSKLPFQQVPRASLHKLLWVFVACFLRGGNAPRRSCGGDRDPYKRLEWGHYENTERKHCGFLGWWGFDTCCFAPLQPYHAKILSAKFCQVPNTSDS